MNRISKLNKNVKAIGLALVIALFGGIGVQSCTYDFGMDSISIEQTARLELSLVDFLDFLDHYYDYETHLRINAIYGGSFKPLVDLSSPSLRGTTIDAKTAISSLLNENRVFQFEDKVIFVNEDFSVMKAIKAADYEIFLKSRPTNTLNIPENIIIAKIWFSEDNHNSTRGSWRDCVLCGVRAVAFIAHLVWEIPNITGDLIGSCLGCIERIRGRSSTSACPPQTDDEVIYIPNPDYCRSYYKCDHGIPVLMFCPDGLLFCSQKNTCSWAWDSECIFDCAM